MPRKQTLFTLKLPILKQGLIYIMKCFLSKTGMPPIAPASCFRKKAQGLGMGAGDSGLNHLLIDKV